MSPRRTALQLTPLLDLLLIVIFAQYLDVGERDRQRVAENRSLAEQADVALRDAQSAKALAADSEMLRQLADARRAAAEEQLSAATTKLQRSERIETMLAQATAALFQIDPALLEQVVSPFPATGPAASESQRADVRRRLRELTSGSADAVVMHLMTHEELRKRVDVWRFHLDADGVATLEGGGKSNRFRVEPANLLRDVGQYVDTLPDPKRLVIVLFTYDEKSRLITIEAVRDRMPRLMERLGQNSGARFDYADLGFGRGTSSDSMIPF